jgi:hypothetical protein
MLAKPPVKTSGQPADLSDWRCETSETCDKCAMTQNLFADWKSYLAAQIDEIRQSSALTVYGAAIAIGHLAGAIHYLVRRYYLHLTAEKEPFCWPFFESCYRYRFLTSGEAQLAVYLLAALSVAAIVCFLKKNVAAGYKLLAGTTAYHFLVAVQDYWFRQNQGYMLLWITLAYLLARSKKQTLALLLVSFYFWAGTLKLNNEWLSGAVLYKPLWPIPKGLVPAACGYVVVLELGIIWGLLNNSRPILYGTLIQLLLFHALSITQVGFWYPTLMIALLSVVLFSRELDGDETNWLEQLVFGKMPRPAYVTAAMFAICQLVPYMYSGDKTLTGQARIIALHMFEARQQCKVQAIQKTLDGNQTINLKLDLVPRMECDPIVYFNRAQNLCRSKASAKGFIDIDFTMDIKRKTDADWTRVIEARNFCSLGAEYSVFGYNPWMVAG